MEFCDKCGRPQREGDHTLSQRTFDGILAQLYSLYEVGKEYPVLTSTQMIELNDLLDILEAERQ